MRREIVVGMVSAVAAGVFMIFAGCGFNTLMEVHDSTRDAVWTVSEMSQTQKTIHDTKEAINGRVKWLLDWTYYAKEHIQNLERHDGINDYHVAPPDGRHDQ